MKSESEVAQSCLTLRDPLDCSLPGSSVHGIFQARVLEWVAIRNCQFYVPFCIPTSRALRTLGIVILFNFSLSSDYVVSYFVVIWISLMTNGVEDFFQVSAMYVSSFVKYWFKYFAFLGVVCFSVI